MEISQRLLESEIDAGAAEEGVAEVADTPWVAGWVTEEIVRAERELPPRFRSDRTVITVGGHQYISIRASTSVRVDHTVTWIPVA